jgi:hypothetical protein
VVTWTVHWPAATAAYSVAEANGQDWSVDGDDVDVASGARCLDQPHPGLTGGWGSEIVGQQRLLELIMRSHRREGVGRAGLQVRRCGDRRVAVGRCTHGTEQEGVATGFQLGVVGDLAVAEPFQDPLLLAVETDQVDVHLGSVGREVGQADVGRWSLGRRRRGTAPHDGQRRQRGGNQ